MSFASGAGTPEKVPVANEQHENGTVVLGKYLGKTLRVHIEDGRMFVGQMKCTDRVCGPSHEVPCLSHGWQDRNIILGNAHEHRALPLENPEASNIQQRFVGLIVVPGASIKKIEVEEFNSSLIR